MTFSTENYEDVIRLHEDPLIINPIIGQNKIWKVMVDIGSLANILFPKTYCKMNLDGEQLEPCNAAPLYAFGGHPIQFEGTITLPVLLVESIPHLKLKFPTEKGVGEMRGDQKTTRIIMLEDLEKDQDYEKPNETGKRKRAEVELIGSRETLNIELEKFWADLSSPVAKPAAKTEEVELYAGHLGKMVWIGKNMESDMKEKVIDVIRQYHDVFAWGPKDMPGLDPKTVKHCLNVRPEAKPVKQKKRTFVVERQKVIEDEVEKLLEAKFTKEIEYPNWLANVVVVKKSNGK
ncbi:uncharacterized protein LOC141714975 [Apium graveolens]|uniref:uncharacterized protein LOC141714975 n=1 Tax=Apium graveolens TaxID=4045 RepID=UPI003D7A7E6C